MCLCESCVSCCLELVEGKDVPPEWPKLEFNNLGKTVGLLSCLAKALWGTGERDIPDSGFCALKGVAQLRKCGVFAAAQMKKQ